MPTSERFSEVIVNRILFSQLVHLKHRGIYKCFGILISIYSVLIAAHCVHKLKPPAYGGAVIVVQYYNTTKQFQNYNIEYILVNKDFQIDIMARVETYANDIAVIVVSDLNKIFKLENKRNVSVGPGCYCKSLYIGTQLNTYVGCN